MNDAEEKLYLRGEQYAWLRMLRECLHELGVDDPSAGQARWVAERAEIVAMLHALCADHGDNEWDDDLNLADVIEKHLWPHLEVTLHRKATTGVGVPPVLHPAHRD